MNETPETALQRLRESFASGLSLDLRWRDEQLAGLESLLAVEEQAIIGALVADLGKPRLEGLVTDVLSVRREVRTLRRHLPRWARRRRVRLPALLLPARGEVRHEPLGVVLVVAPWNYPFNLVLAPLAAALAAGNCVVVKPSELAPRSAALLAELLPRYLDHRAVAVCEGGAEVTNTLIDAGVDHIFFTGSAAVGRSVMARAAENLTPVTLELGGKSPVYVDASADLSLAARRIVWGKFLNAGQTCIAPDYVLAHRAIAPTLLDALRQAVTEFYGTDPKKSSDFARIIDERHVARLEGLLQTSGGEVICGGEIDHNARYVAPTILIAVAPHAPMMSEEIFGPLLPVMVVADDAAALAEIAARPIPLCAYVFARDREIISRFVARSRSGGVVVNTTLEHFAAPDLPFGGLGESGTGAYHGRYGFETFSHLRPVLDKSTWLKLKIPFPPYRRWTTALLRRFF